MVSKYLPLCCSNPATIGRAFGPLTRTTAIAPMPCGVAMAQMVSEFNIMSERQVVSAIVASRREIVLSGSGYGRRLVHHGLLRLRRWSGSGLCADGVETPHAHIGVPFSVELARRDFNLRLDALSGRKFLYLINLVRPAGQADRAWILFFSFDDKVLLAPRSSCARAFNQVSEPDDFSCNFHSINWFNI